jgi:hypothetical protein
MYKHQHVPSIIGGKVQAMGVATMSKFVIAWLLLDRGVKGGIPAMVYSTMTTCLNMELDYCYI